MNYTYELLIDNSKPITYKENTNMFCYYVLTTVLLFNYEQTINWFITHNKSLLQFNNNKETVLLFFNYIKTIYNNKNLLKFINLLKNYNLNNNNMTLFEFNL